MNITPTPANIQVRMPGNERLNAIKVKEAMPEAEFTGLSAKVRVDNDGGGWFLNNSQYTKSHSKYDAYAYEWTVNTCDDYRSSYTENHPTENMGFEDFLGYVRENGLDKKLNTYAIKENLSGTNTSDYTTISQQTDFLAAYYTQLENHINQNFTGNEKQEQMKILTETVGKAINDVADAYAEYAGGFLEKHGQIGEREKVRDSVNSLIEDKINAYRSFIKEEPDFARLNGTEDEWLKDSHRFMTSKLQSAYAESSKRAEGNGVYSETDLLYIGKIASSLPADMRNVTRIADEETIGFTLGTIMAKTSALGDAMGVSASAKNTVKGAVSHYQDDYMSLINREMDTRRLHALNSREREGYGYIDRNAVMKIASKIEIEYENTKNLMKALFKGVTEGFNEHMNKLNSKSHDKLLRYNENNKDFWTGMYSTLDGAKSTSMKIQEDAAVFEWGLSKKALDIDMGFDFLRSGYMSFGGYNAKPVGTVKDVLPGIKV